MAYNTGNPIGSIDPRDAADNKENFDRFALSTERTYTDRLGVERKTVTGALQDYAAFNSRGEWATATAYNVNDIWRDGPTGAFYLVLSDYTSGASAADDIAGGNVALFQALLNGSKWPFVFATVSDMQSGTTVAGDTVEFEPLKEYMAHVLSPFSSYLIADTGEIPVATKFATELQYNDKFVSSFNVDTGALPVGIGRNRAKANQDRWVMMFGDSHSWGQGAPEWDQFSGMTNYSRHSGYPHNLGYMHRMSEFIRDKLWFKENLFTLGGPQSRSPITSLDWRRGQVLDIQGTRPLELILGQVNSESKNLEDISADTITQFYAPVARLDVDTYSTMEYREKAALSLFSNNMMTLRLENGNRFSTQGKEYKIQLPPNPGYAGSGAAFTKLTDSRGNIIAEYNSTSGAFYLITDNLVTSYPEWFKVGQTIYFHGSREAHKIVAFLSNGAIQIQTVGGADPGAGLAPFITDNYTIYHGAYINRVLLRATTHVPTRVTYVHVRHHANGGNLQISWTDAISVGSQLTPFLNTGVSFRATSNPFQPMFSSGLPVVRLVSAGHNLVTPTNVGVNNQGVTIDTSQRSPGVDEELIYRIDWGTKQMGDIYMWSFLDPSDDSINVQTRGLIFDNNKAANYAMGAHTVGAWIGAESSNAGETRDHVADILNYTPVRPSHVITQIPFVNEYIKQTPIATFKANLTAFVARFTSHLSSSNNYNFVGTDFIFFTSLRARNIAFEGAASSPITYDDYVQAAREFCHDNGYTFVDCEQRLFDLVEQGRIDYQRLFNDSIHPSDYANEMIFETLKREYLYAMAG